MMLAMAGDQAAATTSQRVTLAPDEEPSPANEGEITVTGSRIIRDGYSAPTPVSVISTEEINREAPPAISDFLNTLPQVRGSGTAATSAGALSTGGAGIASVNLRNLGANRTLVLLDGQRSVASTTGGTVDTNTIPQSLISRVEVVTGGASSAYGSDAVSGVVNFILNKEYKGLQAEYEYGVTTYGDGGNHKASLTGGIEFGEGRGHLIASGEYFDRKGIYTIDRDWNQNSSLFQVDNPSYSAAACTDNNSATLCVPSRLILSGVGSGNFTPGGLITGVRNSAGALVALTNTTVSAAARTALTNTYFGTIDPSTGRATTGTLAVGTRTGQWMIGGDYKYAASSHLGTASLLPSEHRRSAFGRASYDVTPWFKPFVQVAYAYYRGVSYYQATASQVSSVSSPGVADTQAAEIKVDNPYLPANIVAVMQANNIQSLVVSTGNAGLPAQGSNMRREVYRYVAGVDGDFSLFDRDFHWNTYYQRGITKAHEQLTNAWNYTRMRNATDAVRAADGTIQCRINADASTTNDDPLCFPLNRVGVGGMDQRAIDYVYGNGRNPLRDEKITQDAAALNFSTARLFDVWAGPVSIAFGVEYRKEKVSGSVDPFFAPILTPFTPTWRYGNFIATHGQYNVKEGFVETIVPIIKGMDFQGALRVTDYSTSGRVETWKTGLTWQVINDIKLRGTYSRDIRAPNIQELFAAGGGATNSVNRPTSATNAAQIPDSYINNSVGNPNLKPEVARTLGLGMVLTPSFLQGFAASVDYYKIKLTGAINTKGAQTTVDECYLRQITASCAFIQTVNGTGSPSAPADIISVDNVPINYVVLRSEGIDFEGSYRRRIGPGMFQTRALATRALTNESDDGLGNLVVNTVGSGVLRKWTYRLTAGYTMDNGFGFQAVGRGFSPGTYSNAYIVCSTDCPLSTTDNRTYNYNHINGAWYLDLNADYKFKVRGVKGNVFISIRNVLNTDPVLTAGGPTGDNTEASPQTSAGLYDVLGRQFRVGLRFDY
ncbi:MAG: hypothetical protein DI605_10690 [Sphingomonas sp.]|nr:MAG: hypothetical protein DI605_10690 [Sphingomonas sp.]